MDCLSVARQDSEDCCEFYIRMDRASACHFQIESIHINEASRRMLYNYKESSYIHYISAREDFALPISMFVTVTVIVYAAG